MFVWINRVYTRLSEVAGIAWASIDYTGSNLTDIVTRNHASLQNIGTVDETDTDTTKDKHLSNSLAKGWEDTKTAYTSHAAATNAHGATGALIGTGNTATGATRGPVYQASASTDAAASAVSATSSTVAVTSPDVSTAPATYNATWGGEVEALANELKADIGQVVTDLNAVVTDMNQLVTDVNAIKSSLNDLKAKMRTAEQLGI